MSPFNARLVPAVGGTSLLVLSHYRTVRKLSAGKSPAAIVSNGIAENAPKPAEKRKGKAVPGLFLLIYAGWLGSASGGAGYQHPLRGKRQAAGWLRPTGVLGGILPTAVSFEGKPLQVVAPSSSRGPFRVARLLLT